MATAPVAPSISVYEAVRSRLPPGTIRIYWMALSAVGLRSTDIIHTCPALSHLQPVISTIGLPTCQKTDDATVLLLHRPSEYDIIMKANRLQLGKRMLVFNDERDIVGMEPRTFDLATACIFDQQSKRVLRIFDPLSHGGKIANGAARLKRTRVNDYINVELAEINDSSLAIQASQIAALR